MKKLLTACYIVKNEENNLARNISIIQQLVDEIVIVDTGSTDRTRKIAEQFQVKLYDFPWNNDFSAARNFAIQKANSNWIIFPDADEFLQTRDYQNIRKFLYSTKAEILLCQIDNIDTAVGGKLLNSFYAPRIFKNQADLRYAGTIHEQLRKIKSIPFIDKVSPQLLTFLHTGYSADIIQKKAIRNLPLLLKESAKKEDPILWTELAETYEILNDNKKALYYANKAIQSGRQNTTFATSPYRLFLRLLQKEKAPQKVQEQLLLLAKNDFPEIGDFPAELAQYKARHYQYSEAVKEMKEAIKRATSYSGLEQTVFRGQNLDLGRKMCQNWEQILRRSEKLIITACVIVKNEAHNMERWCQQAKLYSDEQIVVDTGSVDETITICKKYGVIIKHFKWQNDFAAAKNYALKQANGDWIVFLDADEYWADGVAEVLRNAIATADINPKVNAILHLEYDLNDDKIEHFFYNTRIFRRSGIVYQGKIHEQPFAKSGLSFQKIPFLKLYHLGYNIQCIDDKIARNLPILLAEEKRGNKQLLHHLAETYFALGDYRKCIDYIEAYFKQQEYKVLNGEVSIWRNYINSFIKLGADFPSIYNKVVSAIEKYPQLPDFYAFLGWLELQESNYLKAEQAFRQAIFLYGKGDIATESYFASDIRMVQQSLQIIEDKKKKIYISACLIVKNEAKNIADWLIKIKPYADEIIVVDTGSTDNTVELLKKEGITPWHFIWQDDFAMAKNFALRKALGEWIIFLDADEFLQSDLSLKMMLQEIPKEQEVLLTTMVNIDRENANKEQNRFLQARIFRGRRDIHYRGRIHEYLSKKGDVSPKMMTYPEILIYHTGYTTSLIDKKLARNLMMLQKDIAIYGDNPRYYLYLGDCYYGLRNYQKAVYFYEKHLREGKSSFNLEGNVYFKLINSLQMTAQDVNEILPIVNRAIELFPQSAEFLYQKGVCYWLAKNNELALCNFQEALALHKKQKNTPLLMDNFAPIKASLYAYLAYLMKDKDKVLARDYLYMSLRSNKYDNIASQIFLRSSEVEKKWTNFYQKNLVDIQYLMENSFLSGNMAFFQYLGVILQDEWHYTNQYQIIWSMIMNNIKDESMMDNAILRNWQEHINDIFITCLLADRLPAELVNILPPSVWKILEAYFSDGKLDDSFVQNYMSFLNLLLENNLEKIQKRYLQLTEQFSRSQQLTIWRLLIKKENWQAGMFLEKNVLHDFKPEELTPQDEIDIAKAAYYCKDWFRAERYFKKVQKVAEFTNEAQSFLAWIEKRKVGKW